MGSNSLCITSVHPIARPRAESSIISTAVSGYLPTPFRGRKHAYLQPYFEFANVSMALFEKGKDVSYLGGPNAVHTIVMDENRSENSCGA